MAARRESWRRLRGGTLLVDREEGGWDYEWKINKKDIMGLNSYLYM